MSASWVVSSVFCRCVAADRKLTHQVSFDWQHYIPLIERKPGALRNGAPFVDLPKPLRLLKQGLRRHTNGDRIMTQVVAAVPIAGLDPVLVAVELVLESGPSVPLCEALSAARAKSIGACEDCLAP